MKFYFILMEDMLLERNTYANTFVVFISKMKYGIDLIQTLATW